LTELIDLFFDHCGDGFFEGISVAFGIYHINDWKGVNLGTFEMVFVACAFLSDTLKGIGLLAFVIDAHVKSDIFCGTFQLMVCFLILFVMRKKR
jgi:hypothetical protein